MSWHNIYTSRLLFSLFILSTFLFIGVLIYQIQEAKNKFHTDTPLCLQNSIKQIIENKAKDAYYRVQYEYDPNKRKIGEYETRIARYADTIFEYRSKIVDPATAAFRGHQTVFIETNQLHADSIQLLFNSLLQEKNIYVKSIVGITASFYTKKNEWSGDTTTIKTNYRTVFANQGNYEDINYHAYIQYFPYTIWTLMNKKAIYILFICFIISGFILLWWVYKRKQEKKFGIALMKNGNYRIRDIIFNTKERALIHKESKKDRTLTRQLNDLLLLFLEAKHHRVSKEDIKQRFWPQNISAITNMTSAVNRLNKMLKEVDCSYTIITDPKIEEYYIFSCESN